MAETNPSTHAAARIRNPEKSELETVAAALASIPKIRPLLSSITTSTTQAAAIKSIFLQLIATERTGAVKGTDDD